MFPYVLWKEVIKDYLEACSPEQLNRVIGFYPDEVCKLVPELRQKLGAFPQSGTRGHQFLYPALYPATGQKGCQSMSGNCMPCEGREDDIEISQATSRFRRG